MQALGTLATPMGVWHATLAPEVREAVETVRRTQAEAAGFTAQTRVTQRQLDV